MTADIDRRKRVADVVAIIGRDKAHIEEIEEAIQQVDSDEAHPILGPRRGWYRPLNKRDKKMAKSLGLAVERLEKTLGRADVAGVLYRATVMEHDEFFEWTAQLAHWRKRFEDFAGVAKVEVSPLFGVHPIWPLGQPKPSAERFARKNRAVAQAAKLMDLHGLLRTVTRKSDKRKASVFCRVAAALYGDKSADLSHQCRAYNKARNRGSK